MDADDPDERAPLVFGDADVAAVVGAELAVEARRPGVPRDRQEATVDDDAWIIFTSGPKGMAVTHRSLRRRRGRDVPAGGPDRAPGPGDGGTLGRLRRLCEEMWLAWRHAACLVPAPRALVKSGMDVGLWLSANRISIVSTAPTLVSLCPDDAFERVRLLILGGEAVPPELATRLVRPGREVWSTYGRFTSGCTTLVGRP